MKIKMIVAVGLTLWFGACSSASPTTSSSTYFYDAVSASRSNLSVDVLEPSTLVEALPSTVVVAETVKGQVEHSFSDLVITGRIVGVRPGNAVHYENLDRVGRPGVNDEAWREVDFYSSEAHERNVLVTVAVSKSSSQSQVKELEFRMGVPGGGDPEKFMASVRGIGESIILLEEREDGRNAGDLMPILRGAGIGELEPDGGISFPGLGEESTKFVGDLRTSDDVWNATSGSVRLKLEDLNHS